MSSPLRLHDLSDVTQEKLLGRVEALGLQPMLWCGRSRFGGVSEPPNSFHGEGIGWCRGTFFYRSDAELHGFCHEVGHIAQLSLEQWRTLDAEDPKTSEEVALILQVELSRGIRGLGVRKMLGEMVRMDYSLWGVTEDGREVSGEHWWRATVSRRLRDCQVRAMEITERWKVGAYEEK